MYTLNSLKTSDILKYGDQHKFLQNKHTIRLILRYKIKTFNTNYPHILYVPTRPQSINILFSIQSNGDREKHLNLNPLLVPSVILTKRTIILV